MRMGKPVIPLVPLVLMKMFKYRLLLILFLATILIYVAALFWSINDHQEWNRRDLERMLENHPPEVVSFVELRRYIETQQGRSMMWLGLAIGLVWVVGLGLLCQHLGTRELRLLGGGLPLCGVLCFLLGILAFFYYEDDLIFGVVHPYLDYAIPIGLLGIIFFAFSPMIWLAARQNR